MIVDISPVRRDEIIDALGRGTVPARGLDVMAVGLDRITQAVDEELARVAAGGAVFKAVRGEWGSGKTFAARWIAERARKAGFATSELQISETETPLHHLQTVYRRIIERLSVRLTVSRFTSQTSNSKQGRRYPLTTLQWWMERTSARSHTPCRFGARA